MLRSLISLLGLAGAVLALPAACGGSHGAALQVGAGAEMLIDSRLLAIQRGTRLRLHPPERREVVLTLDRPWEGPHSAYFSVLRAGGRIRLYYRGHTPDDSSDEQVACMAESADGIRFTRPSLGLHAFRGRRDNNIVFVGKEAHNFAPFLDPAAQSARERWKALGGVGGRLFAFASPDGLRWHRLREEPVLTSGAFDSLNVAFYDPVARIYRCYSRWWTGRDYRGLRAIQTATSSDFLRWSEPVPCRYASGEPDEHFYTSAVTPCPGAPHILLAFPMRFVPERTRVPGYPEPGVSDALFLTSRDGVLWDRTFREAWLRPGRDPRNWTQRSCMPAWGIVETAPDEFSLYASEHYAWPDNRLRRLVVRRHGFASLHAGFPSGEAVTRPLALQGAELRLNFATSAAGEIALEIQDPAGQPIPGYALEDYQGPRFGDEIDAPARWRRGHRLDGLSRQPLRLRIVLRDADLFALRSPQAGAPARAAHPDP